MGLSCDCDEWDGDGIGWIAPADFSTLNTRRSRRCCSCKSKISPGSVCMKIIRFHYPQDKIELKIYSEDTEIPNAPKWFCERCGEIFLNLDSLGFCVDIESNMEELLEEYRGFQKDNGLYRKVEA